MGFIDLSSSLGRHFGSIGVALNDIQTQLILTPAEQCRVTGECASRAEKCLRALCSALRVSNHLHLHIEQAIPEHVGLGSGTQMSLAVGMALSALYGLNLSVREVAALTERGLRSGIGIGVFEQGGLIVDGGRGENTITPPVLARLPIPEHWRFILVFDERGQGLHGQQELQAFKTLPPFPQSEAQRLCYLLLMQALPALAEHDLISFGAVISQLQNAVGEHFAPAQGGVFTSPEVAQAMKWLEQQGATAIGQTSWGPTGFCVVDNAELADSLLQQANARFAHLHNLRFMLTSARNQASDVIIEKY
jgi:beta-RFAP synthase